MGFIKFTRKCIKFRETGLRRETERVNIIFSEKDAIIYI